MRRGIVIGCTALSVLAVLTLVCLTEGSVWIPRSDKTGQLPPSSAATAAATVTAPASPRPAPTATAPPLVVSPSPRPISETLAAIQTAVPPERDLFELGKAFGRIPLDAERVSPPEQSGYTTGDREVFWVFNLMNSTHFTATATLQLQTEHANWWVQDGYTVAQSDLQQSAQVFETRTYPINREFFGSEWSPGIDNDVRLHVFMGEVPGVGGYFSGADEYPDEINPYSNEKEIFYINLDAARPGQSTFDGTLAHEFQHMIHWNLDSNEDLWVNEGLSELAVKLNGFSLGIAPGAYARDPDRQLTQWDSPHIANYGAAYLFMDYFLKRFGEERLRAVIANPANGAAGFDAVLRPLGLTFEEVFADWLVVNVLGDGSEQDQARGEGSGRPTPDWGMFSPALTATHFTFPATGDGTVHQFGADYLLAVPPAGEQGTLTFEFEGSREVSVLPVEPASGRFLAWSNRGDSSDTRLTRAFDLRGLNQATLRFAVWYDLESGFDYTYICVSTDGGATWQILPATSTSDHDPNGNAFGPAYTGRSGVGPVELGDPRPAEWVEETVDLSPFAGQQILIRFETITDDGLNRPGLAIDDIRIPELDYVEDFEAGLGGWQPEGFVRIDNILPQRYTVQVVIRGDGSPQVRKLELDDANRGRIQIPGFGDEVHEALVIIAGTTPVTTELAPYSYRLTFTPDD